jgi:hypothetical protein
MVQILPENPSFGAQIGRGLGGGISQGFSEALGAKRQQKQALETLREKSALDRQAQAEKLKGEYEADQKSYDTMTQAFGKNFADVWLASPQGARTALTQAALEAKARGIDLDQLLGQAKEAGMLPETPKEQQNGSSFGLEEDLKEKNIPESQILKDLQQHISSQDENLLPEEKIARGKERYSSGLKEYQEATTKLHGMARDKERLDILENLNKSEKLPKNIARLNVDKEGNLKLPFLGSPEAQRYVKTLNEFSAGAKDTFGSRVTNFDLAQYLKRYPTLLNTAEGRRQLIDQMKIVNQINSVYYKNLKKIYDKAGGSRNIDSDAASRFAEQLSEPQVKKLSEKFNQIGQFSSKPAASEFKGKKIRDKETGEVFVSDGKDWVPE